HRGPARRRRRPRHARADRAGVRGARGLRDRARTARGSLTMAESGPSTALREAGRVLGNLAARARDAFVSALPGPRPRWAVLERRGGYPARRQPRRLAAVEGLTGARRETSLDELTATVKALCRNPSLEGVVLRVQGLDVDMATAFALRNLVDRLKA